jgi:hypothetical protein
MKEIDHAAGLLSLSSTVPLCSFTMHSAVADKAMEIFDKNVDGQVSLLRISCSLFIEWRDCFVFEFPSCLSHSFGARLTQLSFLKSSNAQTQQEKWYKSVAGLCPCVSYGC